VTNYASRKIAPLFGDPVVWCRSLRPFGVLARMTFLCMLFSGNVEHENTTKGEILNDVLLA